MKAICQRCGADKPGPLVPCRACTHVPLGEERTVAWLLSEHHLSPAQLAQASRRIRAGHRLAPREDLLAKAHAGLQEAIPGRRRRPKEAPEVEPETTTPEQPPPDAAPTWAARPSLGALLALDSSGPPGGQLPRWALATLGAISLLLTPLPGWVAWWAWRHTAPRAASQVLWVMLPLTTVVTIAWGLTLGLAWGRHWGLL